MGKDIKELDFEEVGANLTNKDHPVKKLPIATKFFETQLAIEKEGINSGAGSGGDFKRVFLETLANVRDFTASHGWNNEIGFDLASEKADQRAEEFLAEFAEIKMDDTFYHDVGESIPEVFKIARGVVLYTQGDLKVQPRKVKNSKIMEILEDAKNQADGESLVKEIITEKKESEIPQTLESFSENLDGGELLVVVYDDSVGNFSKAEEYVKQFEEKHSFKIQRLYVWAKTGRVAENITSEREESQKEGLPDYETVTTIRDLETKIKEKGFDQQNVIVFLDFDGALSDNRLMRVRQAHVAYKHVMKTIKSLVQDSVGWDGRNESTAQSMREKIKYLYSQIDAYWQKG